MKHKIFYLMGKSAAGKDTVYEFYEWARLWGVLLTTFSKDLVPALNSALY